MNTCSTPNCTEKATRKGLCNKHYMRQYRKHQPSYTDGISERRQQVVNALDRALAKWNGGCTLRYNTLTIEAQGERLRVELPDST